MEAKRVRSALGRGLSSLVSTPVSIRPSAVASVQAEVLAVNENEAEGVRFMDISKLITNPKQPRQHFSDQQLEELVASIKHHGLSTTQHPKYHSYHHTSWDNNIVFLRSSYELDYAKELDTLQVEYKVENLRLVYWDSQLHKQRIAIPDFYLPETNTIVEIKSNWTYDEQNMKDKLSVYFEHGYNFKLILDHVEIPI